MNTAVSKFHFTVLFFTPSLSKGDLFENGLIITSPQTYLPWFSQIRHDHTHIYIQIITIIIIYIYMCVCVLYYIIYIYIIYTICFSIIFIYHQNISKSRFLMFRVLLCPQAHPSVFATDFFPSARGLILCRRCFEECNSVRSSCCQRPVQCGRL